MFGIARLIKRIRLGFNRWVPCDLQSSVKFLAGVVSGYQEDFIQLRDSFREIESDIERERWRLDELMRLMEREIPNFVIPGHLEGPRLTVYGEGLSLSDEAKCIAAALESARAERTGEVQGVEIPVPPAGRGSAGDGPGQG